MRNTATQLAFVSTLVAVLSVSGASLALAQEASLTNEERAELVQLLEDSRSEFEALAAASTGDSWSMAPAVGSWSVGEVVEHLVLAEEGIFGMAMGALEADPDPEWEAQAQMPASQLVDMMTDRTQKFQAPDPFKPKGEMSRSELLGKFAMMRARTLDYVRTTEAPVRQHTAEGPAGKMNVHQWLTLIAGHTMRHNMQIAEAQKTLAEGMVKSPEAAVGQ